MKLKLDVLCHQDQMYTILSQNKLKKVWKTGKNPEQKLPNSENQDFCEKKSGTYIKKLEGYLWIKFEEFILIYEAWMQKLDLSYFWLQFRSSWPDCNETQTQCVMAPIKCISSSWCQVSNGYLKACWTRVTPGHHKTPYAPSGVRWWPVWALLWACLKRWPILNFLIKSCLCVRRPKIFYDILSNANHQN